MNEPIVVRPNQGLIDGIQAVGRYLAVIVGFVIALLGLFKTRDIAGMIAYVQGNGGEVLGAVSGLIALGTAAYGVIKTGKRGEEIAEVAADTRVPESVATLK
jgi:hypothetical protein